MQYRNHSRRSALGLFAAAAAAALGIASPAAAQTVLRYSPWLPPKHAVHEGLIRPWIAEVERVTEGRVKVEFLPKAVGKPAAQFQVVKDGLADVGIILPGYNPGRFPLLELGEMPLLSSDAERLATAFYRVYAKHLEPLKPFEGTHVLTLFSTTPNHVVMKSGNIEKLSDFGSKKLRAPTVTSVPIINALGAVAVQKPVSEMYELASSGVVDGTFFAATAVVDWKLTKLLPYMTLVPGGIGQPVMSLLVNQAKWESISEADRRAIMSVSGEKLATAAGRNYADSERRARERLLADGVTVKEGSPALLAEMRQALAPVEQAWIESARKAGLSDPAAVLAEFRAQLR